jgi:hypothetical protein
MKMGREMENIRECHKEGQCGGREDPSAKSVNHMKCRPYPAVGASGMFALSSRSIIEECSPVRSFFV